MPSSVLTDARTIAKGIRLGGASDIVRALDEALTDGPLTPDRIEQLAHPDWDRVQFEEESGKPVSEGADAVGLARLYDPEQTGPAHRQGSWGVAASWYGWLPGAYASRDAALLAYGYVLGQEGPGLLERLRDEVCRRERRPIDAADLIAFAERGAPDAGHRHTAADLAPGMVTLCCYRREPGGGWWYTHVPVSRDLWEGADEDKREYFRMQARAMVGDRAAAVRLVTEPDH
ncbi:hypothetical protein PV387_03495 [Streptomyces sp. ME02-6987-2C]|uniref:hypothetical protein n=1 Tax=unclassified Streptomyces TaxID=2593676 RepID=UPI0029AF617D|nr:MULTISPECIES: hypothetical protein [unclassified Streptomyces]MDX3345905.1 hypothetical protein [Streptomyces sp. ME02-6979A]MDX3365099.1 hypothetical protein [Streptomyces sp. ME02-6987-2C]MDX3404845.1 hypothetical protein [Streptomyces sp. ME02-6977A]MDX3421671.1 hypothetical protein [Streptomyces sp. ME02-6985-2c]